MDNITHTLTGLALSRAGLNRYCEQASVLAMIAANIPDIDMLSLFDGPFKALEMHRGYTHSLLMLPVMAVLPVLLTALIYRRKLPWLAAWPISCAGVASHLLLDWSMSYGDRLLLPFSSTWYHLDWFSLFDWVILAALTLAVVASALARMVGDEIGDRRGAGAARGWAIFALAFFVAYGGLRATMHSRAIAELEARIYDDAGASDVAQYAALPGTLNPFAWRGIVETQHDWHVYALSAFSNFDPGGGEIFYKLPWTPQLEALSRTPQFRYFLYFARFPEWTRSSDSVQNST